MSSDASSYLWNSTCHDLLLTAQDSGANIHLNCCCMWQGEPTCMKLEGLLREVNGREAQFFVRGVSLQAPNPKAEVDSGKRAGVPTELADRLKALERENRELRQANEILRKASAYFAQAELDRHGKW